MKRRRLSKQKITVYALFTIYSLVMLYLLFFQRLERDVDIPYLEYLKSSINCIPFKTIINYSLDVKYGNGMSNLALKNLSGNILLFIPLGFFLPTIFKKLRKISRFLITVISLIVAVEVIQLLTMLGSCDIDDLIFNVLGASIGFGIWKLKPIIKILRKYKIM